MLLTPLIIFQQEQESPAIGRAFLFLTNGIKSAVRGAQSISFVFEIFAQKDRGEGRMNAKPQICIQETTAPRGAYANP